MRRHDKAESIHDLRASSVSSMLRVPPSTPPPTLRTPLNAPSTPTTALAPQPPTPLSPPADADAIELTELTAGGRRKGPDAHAHAGVVVIRRSLGADDDGLLGAHSHTCSAAVAARQRLEEHEVINAERLSCL